MLIGVLGGGQLGMMTAQAGVKLGHTFRFLDSAPDSPARVAGELQVGDFTDTDALRRFARGLGVVTWEFENVPCSAVQVLSRSVTAYPGIALLEIAQDRLSEKTAFREIGLAPARHLPVSSLHDLRDAVSDMGVPCILKTRRMGYDGKGQFLIRSRDDIDTAWKEIGQSQELILEGFVEFEREVSLIACRAKGGAGVGTGLGAGARSAGDVERGSGGRGIAFYPMPTNVHRAGILRVSRVGEGAEIEPELEHAARAAVEKLMVGMDYVGVLTVEFFVVKKLDGGRALIANEMAPRVHNSGHWSIEGSHASQFENHCRAITGMELGSAALVHPAAAMVNIVGAAPRAEDVQRVPGAYLHLYGKEPREGRKLGHITLVGSREQVESGLSSLRGIPGTVIE
ncbi:MAG: 5-(carboxyamino)imidazole ribonucleotide synthase [Phycisphaeraceae bacterium]|nr:5-(carboxyamino)imidazole ribonucleotide synthase [Phycisphaeraceae bacterium]